MKNIHNDVFETVKLHTIWFVYISPVLLELPGVDLMPDVRGVR